MRTTERITVTMQRPFAEAVRAAAVRRGESVSALIDFAVRRYLIAEALRTEPETDPDWLEAVAETIDGEQ